MTDADPVPPSLPPAHSASHTFAQAGCIIACGLALLPILYVGSFAYLLADSLNEWSFCESLDEGTVAAIEILYLPLLWLFYGLDAGWGPCPA